MTELVFRDDAYVKSCDATVTAINDRGGIELNRTVFYPTGGGQPGDSGIFRQADGNTIKIATAVKGENIDDIVHVVAEGETLPSVGDQLSAEIDWERRYRHMRIHTGLHLLSAVLPYPVTGGQISTEKGRLDFDLPEMLHTKDEIAEKINRLVDADLPVQPQWITDTQLDAEPDLVKTMSVKPPRGAGRVRLIKVGDCDLQPCGGTHVKNTSEIGRLKIGKIEKKGRQNRRVAILFDE